MPFDPFLSRPLTAVSIRANAPAVSGVYGVTNASEWIYIGQSDNVQSALLAHLLEGASALMSKHPTGFVFELCDPARRPARLGRLLIEYAPTCNQPASPQGGR